MSDLPKTYDPKRVEEKWYDFWLKNGFFQADANSDKPPYCIILPPPNVTGRLHMGHGLVNTLQDILARFKKMNGFEVLWLPGTDHAGISTQTIVERDLFAKTGKRRTDFTREEFLKHLWHWKEVHQDTILSQLKKLGCSLDWSRLTFTLDPKSQKAVRVCFKKMYDEGLIYRGNYLVNWDPILQTAIADDEVEHEERNSCLFYVRYPIENTDDHLIIATTRPETMLGDVAVAISPSDKRYTHLIGSHILLPFTERQIPIIQDHMVDPEFGTGVVKITPAHDYNDHEVATRHNLELINIMNPDGTIIEEFPDFAGLTMEEARSEIVSRLRDLGLLEKIEPYSHRVGVSYRTKAVIEPYLSKQWFVKMTSFKQDLINAIKDGHIDMHPEGFEKTYFHWIENLRDWCISRQLWWGHRIPIWYNKKSPEITLCSDTEDPPQEVLRNPEEWVQEEDVLDTWFSSALWPLTTLGWPDKTPDFSKFYPTATLITGHDILFFWVARMILMGKYLTGEMPFKETFLHGLIYGKSYWRTGDDGGIDYVSPEERLSFEKGESRPPENVNSRWEKMSKSKGNVLDPIEVIDEYGADAMRLALCASVTHARQIDLDRRRFDEYKNFANKVWNATRFIMMNLELNKTANLPPLTIDDLNEEISETLLSVSDKWILTRLHETIESVTKSVETYTFDVMAKEAYRFFWDEFCSYYLELCKPFLFGKEGSKELRKNKQKILLHILVASIRLLHPVAPFMTQEIFSLVKARFPFIHKKIGSKSLEDISSALAADTILTSPFPTKESFSSYTDAEKTFKELEEVVYCIRNIRGEMKIPLAMAVDLHIIAINEKSKVLLIENQAFIKALVRVGSISISLEEPKIDGASTAISSIGKILIPLPESLSGEEVMRLKREYEKVLKAISGFQNKLSNSTFIEKAPENLVENTKKLLSDALVEEKEISKKLQFLGG